MTKKYFKVHFIDSKKEPTQITAYSLNQSQHFGFIEVSDLMFIDESEILITPDEDKMRKEFKNVAKTHLPIGSIIRIDEISEHKDNNVIRLVNNTEKNEDNS